MKRLLFAALAAMLLVTALGTVAGAHHTVPTTPGCDGAYIAMVDNPGNAQGIAHMNPDTASHLWATFVAACLSD